MRGYSVSFSPEECAFARLEGVNASYKDLAEVCGRIRGKDASWAAAFLEKVAKGELPVLYKAHCKKIGHRRELGGKKGRYPRKAAKIVLKVLKSAISNGITKGLGDSYTILSAVANKKATYPRVASKGGWMRSDYELARVEIVLKPLKEAPKGVEVKS
ncbi:MAG: uL22 family ribosomal protein [Candidatus Bilamarchaeaceae archaeon]